MQEVSSTQLNIDIVLLSKRLLEKNKSIIISGFVGLIIAILFLILVNNEYTVETKLLTVQEQSQSPIGAQLGGLAGLAGINIPESKSGISSSLYPEIVASLPFQLEILDSSVRFDYLDSTLVLRDYFATIYYPAWDDLLKQYTVNLPKTIYRWISGSNANQVFNLVVEDQIYKLGVYDKRALREIKERILVEVDESAGIILISTEMPDKRAAAQLNRITSDILKKYVVDYKVSKAKDELAFIEKSYFEIKEKYERLQLELALHNDKNKFIATTSANIERQKLESAFQLTSNLYHSLASQREQAKISLNKETPVYTVIEPAIIPNKASFPNPIAMIIFLPILAMFLTIGVLVLFMLKEFVLDLWSYADHNSEI